MAAGRSGAEDEKLRIRRPLGVHDVISVRTSRGRIVFRGQELSVSRAYHDAAFHIGRGMEIGFDWKHQRPQALVRRGVDLWSDLSTTRFRSRRRQQFMPAAAVVVLCVR